MLYTWSKYQKAWKEKKTQVSYKKRKGIEKVAVVDIN